MGKAFKLDYGAQLTYGSYFLGFDNELLSVYSTGVIYKFSPLPFFSHDRDQMMVTMRSFTLLQLLMSF